MREDKQHCANCNRRPGCSTWRTGESVTDATYTPTQIECYLKSKERILQQVVLLDPCRSHKYETSLSLANSLLRSLANVNDTICCGGSFDAYSMP